jgi:TorA maturation chaperone TorD
VSTLAPGGVALAGLWRLLSLGFASPTEDTLAEVEALADALAEAGAPSEVEDVLLELARGGRDELAADHAWLFGGTVRVSPYEGSYELDPVRQGRQMADVAAFYRAFGAEAHGPTAERPDFVGCELEFLSFLELRRLLAVEREEDGVELLDDIASSFLAEHAGRWLPTFFAAVSD